MTTVQSQIAEAMADALRAEPAVAGGRVFVGRARPIGADKPNAIVLRLERSMSHAAETLDSRTSWSTLVAVECYGRSVGDVVDAEADAVVEAVFARFDENSGLGGLVMDIEPLAGETLSWDFEQMESNMTCITARFVVKHQTNGRTLTL